MVVGRVLTVRQIGRWQTFWMLCSIGHADEALALAWRLALWRLWRRQDFL